MFPISLENHIVSLVDRKKKKRGREKRSQDGLLRSIPLAIGVNTSNSMILTVLADRSLSTTLRLTVATRFARMTDSVFVARLRGRKGRIGFTLSTKSWDRDLGENSRRWRKGAQRTLRGGRRCGGRGGLRGRGAFASGPRYPLCLWRRISTPSVCHIARRDRFQRAKK